MVNKELRKSILENSYKCGACHIGSALSCVDIIAEIYKKKKKKDIFLFGKASGVCALYAVLADRGVIPKKKVAYYLKHYPLPSQEVPGVLHSFGSLGHALPVACGLAMAEETRRVFVLLGEGDVQEGTFWESILFARHHRLNNLEIIVDKNGLQALDKTKNVLGIDKALYLLKQLFPIKVVKTIKGKGVDFLENKVESHYMNLTKELYERAIFQISN